MSRNRPCYRFVKRAFDLAVAGTLVLLFSPILVVLWVLVARDMGRPVLFRQVRAGRGGKPFSVFKFRSMSNARDASGRLLPDLERITALGRFLRRSSLDELPQLVNVLRGDMSLVGPRPLYLDYIPRYSPEQARRLDVKPGITGLAQVSGRNFLGWPDRLRMDVQYVDQASFLFDLVILARTARKVISHQDVPSTGVDPSREFMGEEGDPDDPSLAQRRDVREGI